MRPASDVRAWIIVPVGADAEIAARIGEELFGELDAPVTRVAAMDTPVAYAPALEEVILPQSADILAAIRKLKAY